MTIVRTVTVVPAMDKIGAMRSILEDRIRSTPGKSFSVNVLGETATFVQTTVFDSLEAY